MIRFIFTFILMICSSLVWPTLPSISSLVCVSIVGLWFFYKRRLGLAGLACGLVFISAHAGYYQSITNQLYQEGANFSIKVEVLAVVNMPSWDKLTVKLLSLPQRRLLPLYHPRLQVYFSNAKPNYQALHAGDVAHLSVKLKPAYGSVNPHGFNYLRWLVANNIVGKGSVQALEALDESTGWRRLSLHRLRQSIAPLEYGGELYALATGDKQLISNVRQQRYQRLGLSHLFVVSGLHLGIVAAWAWLLGFVCSLLLPTWRRYLPCVCSIAAACAYGWLSGWGLPVQRAFIMLVILSLSQFTLTRYRPWQVLLLSMAGVVILWPLSVYSNSFWLSFSAVSVILMSAWLAPPLWWQKLLLIQGAIMLLMLPLQLALFAAIPYSAGWLNIILVPLFSAVIMPLVAITSLVTLVFNYSLSGIWLFLDKIMAWINLGLEPLVALQADTPSLPDFSMALVLILVISMIFLSLASRRSRYYMAFVAIALGLLLIYPLQMRSDWSLTVFDVGQGQALAIRQGKEVLLYDSGARYRSGFSFAENTIIPYLQAESTEEVLWLVTSHGDNDHAGGRLILEQQYPNAIGIYGQDKRLPAANCVGQQQWRQLSLSFYYLARGIGNEGSCILLVDSGQHRLLLVGDIEGQAEQALIDWLEAPVDVLISPHHGSRSSSSPAFVDATQAPLVIHSVGAFNRYGFPHQQTLIRYASSRQLRSDRSGAIEIQFQQQQMQIDEYRQRWLSPWYFNLIYW